MQVQIVYVVGIVLVLMALVVRRFYGKHAWVRRNTSVVEAAMFVICFLLIGYHFYQKRLWVGLLAVGMGSAAVGKYLYDQRKHDEEERNND